MDHKTIYFFVLGEEKNFLPLGRIKSLQKLFLSARARLLVSSAVRGEKMESASRPFVQTLLLALLCSVCSYLTAFWHLQSQRYKLPACSVHHIWVAKIPLDWSSMRKLPDGNEGLLSMQGTTRKDQFPTYSVKLRVPALCISYRSKPVMNSEYFGVLSKQECSCSSLSLTSWQGTNSDQCPQRTWDFPPLPLFRKKHKKNIEDVCSDKPQSK